MITDQIKNIDIYQNIPKDAKDFIKNLSKNIKSDRYELNNGNYANVDIYSTKPLTNGKYEAHEKYIDIQLLISGQEKIYYKNRESLTVKTSYDTEKDIIFYNEKPDRDFIKLDGSNFIVLFPHEAHAPQICVNNPEEVFKVVVKIKV